LSKWNKILQQSWHDEHAAEQNKTSQLFRKTIDKVAWILSKWKSKLLQEQQPELTIV
jgi:hypothetical protein